MIAYYLQILDFHRGAAFASGALFLLRALAVNLGARRGDAGWAMAAPLRFLSYAIDTALLAAAFALMSITHQYPGVQPWLTLKVALVLLYVVLGSFALKRARTDRGRRLCTLGAVATYAFIVGVALYRSPWGFLAPFVA